MAEISIVIPTHHESDNLARLLPLLFDILRTAKMAAEVIVVDDDSRDGTSRICGRLAATESIRLITRIGTRGLATAALKGLHEAKGNIGVVMDADFSHPPESVPALIDAVRSPMCDFAIGSRYTKGAAIDENWSALRRLNSSFASLLARGLTPVSDPLSGFFAIKLETLSRAKVLRPLGYKIGLELIVRCDCRNIVEVPITFQNRTVGKSRLSVTEQFQYLRHLGRLYSARFASESSRDQSNDNHLAAPTHHRAA